MTDAIRHLQNSYKTGASGDSGKRGGNRIRTDFLVPCLKNCKLYRRGTGAFSSSALMSWADAMEHVIRDDVKIQILTAPNLDFKTQAALWRNQDSQERADILRHEANTILLKVLGIQLKPENMEYRQALLSWMLANDILEIKFAFLRDFYPYPNFQEGETGYVGAQFHTKDGYFEFPDGDQVAFSGTFNETDTGINRNIEKVNCFRSWVPGDEERLKETINDVNNDWLGVNNEEIIVEDVSRATLKKVKNVSHKKPRPKNPNPKTKKPKKAKKKTPTLNPGSIPPETGNAALEQEFQIPEFVNVREGKWSFQGEAVDAWINNGYRGVLEMATGSGKTITSLVAAHHLFLEHNPLLIVISARFRALIDQWTDVCETFQLNVLNLTSYSQVKQKKKLLELKMSLETGYKKVGVIVVSDDRLVKQEFHELLRKIKVKKLHIGDEVHNLGRLQFINNPTDFFDYRLGLSATPDRQYDEEGTDELFNYFGNKKNTTEKNIPVFIFELKDAMDAGVLVPYDYHIHEIPLNEHEMEEYSDLTAQVNRIYGPAQNDDQLHKTLSMLYLRRRKILENAEGKLNVLKEILVEQKDEINFTLIFASAKGDVENEYREDDKQINEANKMLMELDISHHQITGSETQNSHEMNTIKKNFKEKFIKVLTSMVVLDEGVDIPEIRQAFFLSSSTTKRQWVQRRGRVLRTSKGKVKSVIHDFLVIPHSSANDQETRRILKSELTRIEEFAGIALNQWDNDGPHIIVENIKNKLYVDR